MASAQKITLEHCDRYLLWAGASTISRAVSSVMVERWLGDRMLVVTKLWGCGVRKNISEGITALDGRQTTIRPFGIFGRAPITRKYGWR